MGKLKEAVLSGSICEICMTPIEKPTGYPTRCEICEGFHNQDDRPNTDYEDSLERSDYF